jgi:flagellar biosynthesis protein FliQ
MTESYLLNLAQNALTVTLLLVGPVLIVCLVIGVIINVIQAATQLNEATLSFVPKLVGVCAVLLVFGSWMLQQISSFTITLYSSLPSVVQTLK